MTVTDVTGESGVATQTVSSSASPPNVITITGIKDANGDGLITRTISAPTWFLNGLDVVQDPSTLPNAP